MDSTLIRGQTWQRYLAMASNVKKEIELYEPMRIWLQKYLEDKYKGAHIVTVDSHARTLDVILEDYGMIDHYPQTVGLDIQIDVLGIIVKGGKSAIAFIEAKKTQLNLHDLGQLWAYCKLSNCFRKTGSSTIICRWAGCRARRCSSFSRNAQTWSGCSSVWMPTKPERMPASGWLLYCRTP